jgi:ATP-binding cassette subfamily F protein uup
MESFQPYSEYLEIEKELRELQTLENEISKEAVNERIIPTAKKQTKLSYKDQREYDILPKEIEDLELKLDEINACLMNPKCYEQKGIVAMSNELEKTRVIYEQKVERFLELEELIESFNS